MCYAPIRLAAVCLLASAATAAPEEPTATIIQPTPRAVFQRGPENGAAVPIAGTFSGEATRAEARALVMPGGRGRDVPWRAIDRHPADGKFAGALAVPAGGWYRIEIRTRNRGHSAATAAVEKVGVGELFITAGQSNSANHGNPALVPKDDRVSAWGPAGWQHAADPQPIATGRGGTPWPALGDLLVEQLGVPVGFISVGWGGTSVQQWQPGGNLYPRLKDALAAIGRNGARAILWHQGESDTVTGTTAEQYATLLRAVIAQSRADVGWDVPWLIAGVAYIGPQHRTKEAAVREGQKAVCDGRTTFVGPTTDDLTGADWRYDGVHFNEAGLREHARRWADVLVKAFERDFRRSPRR